MLLAIAPTSTRPRQAAASSFSSAVDGALRATRPFAVTAQCLSMSLSLPMPRLS